MSTPNSTASKRIATGFAAVLGMALMAFEAMPAQAAPPPHAPAWGYRKKQEQQRNRNLNYGGDYRYRNTRSTARFPGRSPHPADIDGDGRRNNFDPDMDGDGIPNHRDRDTDGDGIPDSRDPLDSTSARWRKTGNGQWVRTRAVSQQRRPVPYGYYRNSAGRLIRRPRTIKQATFTPRRERRIGRNIGDRDRDGLRNRRDRDIDGDGVRNRRDRNRDGDRFRNRRDRFDRNPRRH